ncbi:hypothetical protein [Natronomonas marina]|uniref:hypothetical protein n=1 Tax=Natronomonas marina TaxID=2961939 RepID=UPI0020C9E471|nr:hypothetical protein [Natronomonas marina]
MPGAGSSDSLAMKVLGVAVALVAIVGYLYFGWSFDGADGIGPTAIGATVAIVAVGWTVYTRV